MATYNYLLLLISCLLWSCSEPSPPSSSDALPESRLAERPDFGGVYQQATHPDRALSLRPVGDDSFLLQLSVREGQGCEVTDTLQWNGNQLQNASGSLLLERREGALYLTEAGNQPVQTSCGTGLTGDYAPLGAIRPHIPSGYVYPTPDLWIPADEQEALRDRGATFHTEILTSGDYDGDDRRDYALIAVDTAGGRLQVYAFHGISGSYESFEVYSLGALSKTATAPQYIRAGLDTRGPGLQAGYQGGTPLDLANDGIIIKFYDQVRYLFYWQGGEYVQFLLPEE